MQGFSRLVAGWSADFADPISFLDLFTTGNAENNGKWSNKEYDKRDDIETLRHLGAPQRTIVRIFLHESRMITAIGAVAGILLGLLLCWLQMEFGLLRFGNSGNFIVDAYPVSVSWVDVVLVLATVLTIGFTTAWYPVRYLTRKLIASETA